jgi:hypothetical protein
MASDRDVTRKEYARRQHIPAARRVEEPLKEKIPQLSFRRLEEPLKEKIPQLSFRRLEEPLKG